ncbi:MAG: MATE family efflux transporter, partial [Deltaproteobacteria bacterium]
MSLSRNIIANKASWAIGRTRARVISFVAQGEVVMLAWPIASAMLGETIMGLVDTKLVGNLGAAALGGVGVAGSLLHLSYVTVLGLMRGVKVCTAYAVGRGQPYHGIRYAQMGMVLGIGCGALCAVGFQYAAPALKAVQIGPDLIAPAIDFLKARSWGLPATFGLIALIEHRQGVGDVRTPMLVGLVGNVINAFLAYGLIYGHFGLPALGVKGAGYGTSIVEFLQLSALGVLLWRSSRQQKKAPAAMPELHWRLALRELLMVGMPTALHFGFETTAFVAFTAILG